jgi:ABC-2 type transport system permease protein
MTATPMSFGGGPRSAAREFGWAVNTIMVKELRSRMRGRRAFVVLTIYLAILALITYGVYVVVGPSVRAAADAGFGGGFGQANASAIIGQSIFTVLSIFQLILVCFIAPAFTAGQISLEREKQTLDLLVSTPMRPGAIVIGKLAAALAFVVLMIVAAVPITAIVLMYGGAAIGDIVRQQVVLLASAMLLGTVGLFFSALIKRTQAATVLTYITMLALTLGTVMIFIFWTAVANTTEQGLGIGPPKRAPEQVLYLNPGIAMLDVVSNTEPGGFGSISGILAEARGARNAFGGGMVDQFGNQANPNLRLDDGGPGYWWPRIAITFVVLSALLTFASMRLVVPAGMRWAFRRPRAATTPAAALPATDDARPAIEEIER